MSRTINGYFTALVVSVLVCRCVSQSGKVEPGVKLKQQRVQCLDMYNVSVVCLVAVMYVGVLPTSNKVPQAITISVRLTMTD